jgi:O-antigen ligase
MTNWLVSVLETVKPEIPSMHTRVAARFLYPPEVYLLSGVVITLPMFEGPKNVLWGVWVAVWLLSRLKDGDWGGPWNRWDSLIVAWIASVLLSAIFAGATHSEWDACRDVVRYTSVLWLLTRSNYGEAAWKMIYAAFTVSVIVATTWALAALAWPHEYLGIQLNSVGHVNHSVIYIVICFGALVAALATYWQSLSTIARAWGIAGILILLIAVALAGSRAAAVAVMVLALGLGVVWLRRSPFLLRWALMSVVVFVILIVGLNTEIWRKQEFNSESAHPVLGARYPIWNQALLEWRMHPIFGIGNSNFSQLRDDGVQRWLVSKGEPYVDGMYARSSHAHSLYLNTLAERGLVGFAALLALLGAFAISLLRGIPRRRDPALHWLLWCGASSAFLTTAGIGLVNTTLHNEPGLLTMLLMGAWLGYRRRELGAVVSQSRHGAIEKLDVARGPSL